MPNQQCQSNAGVPFATTLSTHTHTRLTALCPGLPRWAGTRKVKSIWILLKQETVSGSGISWAICKSAPRSRQITTPVLHYSSFLQAGCPSCCPTVSKHWRINNTINSRAKLQTSCHGNDSEQATSCAVPLWVTLSILTAMHVTVCPPQKCPFPWGWSSPFNGSSVNTKQICVHRVTVT